MGQFIKEPEDLYLGLTFSEQQEGGFRGIIWRLQWCPQPVEICGWFGPRICPQGWQSTASSGCGEGPICLARNPIHNQCGPVEEHFRPLLLSPACKLSEPHSDINLPPVSPLCCKSELVTSSADHKSPCGDQLLRVPLPLSDPSEFPLRTDASDPCPHPWIQGLAYRGLLPEVEVSRQLHILSVLHCL